MSTTASAQGRCQVVEEHLDVARIRVSPRGVSAFDVAVAGAGVTARPTVTSFSRVEIRSGLLFEGDSDALTYALRVPVSTGAGMVEVSTSARLRRVRPRGAGVAVRAQLGFGVAVLGVSVPCDALTLGPAPASTPDTEAPRPGDGTFWIPRTRALVFQAHPGRGPRISVRASIPVMLSMTRIARRGVYYRLRWSSHDGSSILGWVHQDTVEVMPIGSMAGSTGGSGTLGCTRQGRRAGTTGLYRGPAAVRVGAAVFAQPDVGRWASFAATDEILVEHLRGQGWVRVVIVPGLNPSPNCRELVHAWVALADVTFPDDVENRREGAVTGVTR